MLNKSEIFKNAWFYFKKGWYNKNFSICLKKAWAKAKAAIYVVEVNADITKETEKALKFATDFGNIWIPKSAIKEFNQDRTVAYIKEWFINSLDFDKKYALLSA